MPARDRSLSLYADSLRRIDRRKFRCEKIFYGHSAIDLYLMLSSNTLILSPPLIKDDVSPA